MVPVEGVKNMHRPQAKPETTSICGMAIIGRPSLNTGRVGYRPEWGGWEASISARSDTARTCLCVERR